MKRRKLCGLMIRGERLSLWCLIEASSVPLVILALYIPPLYTVQSERLTEWRRETEWNRQSEGDGGGGCRDCCKERKTIWCDTVGNGQKGGGEKLSCRCYQVKPSTTVAMVTPWKRPGVQNGVRPCLCKGVSSVFVLCKSVSGIACLKNCQQM